MPATLNKPDGISSRARLQAGEGAGRAPGGRQATRQVGHLVGQVQLLQVVCRGPGALQLACQNVARLQQLSGSGAAARWVSCATQPQYIKIGPWTGCTGNDKLCSARKQL